MNRSSLFAFALMLMSFSGALGEQPGEEGRAYEPSGSYAVVVSRQTLDDPGWGKVVQALRDKYDAALIVYPRGQLDGVAQKLAEVFPRYACFVATSEEAGRDFVVRAHRLTRTLDDDPYTDLVWGILTGYDAADALRVAERKEPLVIRRAASSMGPGIFANLEGGFASAETNKTKFFHKEKGGETVEEKMDLDALARLADYFNNNPPDLFLTSGHATENDWQTYFNIPGGQFRCKDGQLFALDSNNKRYDINSPHPKVYLPAGNCLIGHVTGPNCMAIAWMHTGGVHQMAGYTAVTFFGYMGWGTNEKFGNPWNLADAVYFTNQALIYQLNAEFPAQANINFDSYDERAIGRTAAAHGIRDRKLLGYLWDRDIFAFYGDPAWVARKPGEGAWACNVERAGESVAVTVTAASDGKWPGKPLVIPLPDRLTDIRSVACDAKDVTPVVTDNLIVLPLAGRERKAGDKIVITFGARKAPARRTSGDSPALAAGPGGAAVEAPATTRPAEKLAIAPDDAASVQMALRVAGENRQQLIEALNAMPDQLTANDMVFLITNMPARDLQSLSADYLIKTVQLARQARGRFPWASKYDDAVFRNDVLPYASLTEAREDWRAEFLERFAPVVKDCATAGEAAVKLNQTIFTMFGVTYDIKKRPRPDEGPLSTIKVKHASCTGLSVLLVDACRAVGVPARIAGVAQWGPTRASGNHTWVEVRDDDGSWYALGASESKALNHVWFARNASKVDESNPINRIYATTFTRQPLRFPIAWNPYAEYVSAVDRTSAYRDLKTPAPAASPATQPVGTP